MVRGREKPGMVVGGRDAEASLALELWMSRDEYAAARDLVVRQRLIKGTTLSRRCSEEY